MQAKPVLSTAGVGTATRAIHRSFMSVAEVGCASAGVMCTLFRSRLVLSQCTPATAPRPTSCKSLFSDRDGPAVSSSIVA